MMSDAERHSRSLTKEAQQALTLISRHLLGVIEELAYIIAKDTSGGLPDYVDVPDVYQATQLMLGMANEEALLEPIKRIVQNAAGLPDTVDFLELAEDLHRAGPRIAEEVSTKQKALADWASQLNPLPAESFADRPWIFISYARGINDEVVESLAHDLGEYELNVFLDKQSIEPGVDWLKTIGRGMLQCRAFLAVITSKFLGSPHCSAELLCALMLNKPLVPALLGIAIEELPAHLVALQCVPIGQSEQQRRVVERLSQMCQS